MLKEIGSEFWNNGPIRQDRTYLLSGRTALEFIIRDILKNYNIKSVLIPSYCCYTMIEPFVRNNISVRFYDVYFDENNGLSVEIPTAQKNEIFYYMTYFGFNHLMGIDTNKIKEDFEVIIQDKTHSWLTGNDCHADYNYVSCRKWTGVDAIAFANKKKGVFSEFPQKINVEYSNIRKKAFSKKRDYIEFGIGNKQEFLDLFEEAEEMLENDYVGYKSNLETVATLLQLDTAEIAKKRQQNAQILIDGLYGIQEMRLMFNSINDDEVPLFVPVLLRENRMELRKYLIDNKIYCPIHWPKSEYHKGITLRADKLYDQELSLICDQRYDSDDMNRIVECIREFYKR